jgi:UDP-GlcNAc:undecaprenyl-phosphate GlcNAc-1-phosphate transferase
MVGKGIVIFLIAMIVAWVITPAVMKLAFKIGTIDTPSKRRVHTKKMPRIGGLSIIVGFISAYLFASYYWIDLPLGILFGALVIGLTGFLDDKFQLSPLMKLVGQSAAAIIIISNGIYIQVVTIPFEGMISVPLWISIPATFIWIIGVTNAINLIDGLDGLASGVSAIAAASIFVMAILMGNFVVATIAIALIGAILGFLYFNFHPAKIFMGDTGSLFLGFILAILSLMGFKQIATVSLIVPIIILGVPIADTAIAIVRRIVNNKRITDADKNHLHHKLLDFGYTHTQTVLLIYGIACIFGITAVLFSQASLLGTTLISIGLMLFIELLIEKLSLINKQYRPLLTFISKVAKQQNR